MCSVALVSSHHLSQLAPGQEPQAEQHPPGCPKVRGAIFQTAAGRVIRRQLQATNPRTYFSVTYNDLTSFLAANSQEANHTVVVFTYNCPKIMKPFRPKNKYRIKCNNGT